ncbi:MAG: hypothetical protein HY534_06075 [Chloroflexi bacterium]|nr:hypothetical protein [Chloroflexota bacterium]
MSWSPIEVIAILFVWFPFALPLILTPYFLTIFSANVLGGGSYAVVQDATEGGARLWFSLLTAVFTTVLVGGIILLVLTAPR